MKKRRASRMVEVLRSIFNVRSWSDWDRMKSFTSYLGNGFKKFFVPQEPVARESFEEARKRLNLSDTDLVARQRGLLRLSLIMAVFAVLLLFYGIYQHINVHFLSASLSLVVMLIALVLAFRYHFWYFQIKERKLGCSVREWFKQGLMGEKP